MKNDDNLGLMAVMLEVGVVLVLCLIILARQSKRGDFRTDPPVTPTEIPSPTEQPTPSPSPTATLTPAPTKQFTAYRAYFPKTCTIKPVESGHKYKAFERWTSLNAVGSTQWRLQQIARTAENGIRVVKDPEGFDRYCVALGTFWAGGHPEHIGRCVDIVMVNGAVLRCVLGDVKRTEDTKRKENKYGAGNNDVLEFIVELKELPEAARASGDCSKISQEFEGDAKEMIVWDMWIEGFGK